MKLCKVYLREEHNFVYFKNFWNAVFDTDDWKKTKATILGREIIVIKTDYYKSKITIKITISIKIVGQQLPEDDFLTF